MIAVDTLHYLDIYKKFPELVVPDYQRAYTWNLTKIEDLINDWQEFIGNENADEISYYMGTLLFYFNNEKNQYEIIDGQQRLTSLALVYHCMYGLLLSTQNLSFNQYASAHNVVKNHEYLLHRAKDLDGLKAKNILNKLQFTIIVSDSEDNAFTFFDSQNNRGVSLGVDDYLKAYHLRAIPECNQEKMAKDWEAVTFLANKNNLSELNLNYLFENILFKSRKWKGQKHYPHPNKDNVLKEFQKQTHQINKDKQRYRLFSNKNNMRFQEIAYQDGDKLAMLAIEEAVDHNNFPFAIRQPLFAGHNFFLYTQKYHSIFKLLFFNKHEENNVLFNVSDFYKRIYTKDMSKYLKEYMQLCMVMYYDNFGTEEIEKAIQLFDYYIGSIRATKYYVRAEAVKKSLIEAHNNLLDIIQSAYLPSDVFQFIKEEKEVADIYLQKKYLNQKGEYKNNVIEGYILRISEYYNINENSFNNRSSWLA